MGVDQNGEGRKQWIMGKKKGENLGNIIFFFLLILMGWY